jgi:hypothetical protein
MEKNTFVSTQVQIVIEVFLNAVVRRNLNYFGYLLSLVPRVGIHKEGRT